MEIKDEKIALETNGSDHGSNTRSNSGTEIVATQKEPHPLGPASDLTSGSTSTSYSAASSAPSAIVPVTGAPSRRDFLKGTASLGAGLLLASSASSARAGDTPPARTDKKPRPSFKWNHIKSPTLLDSVGRLTRYVSVKEFQAWKEEIHRTRLTPTNRLRLAQLHIWAGEYNLNAIEDVKKAV